MNLSKEFTLKGKWFLPNKENDFCYGELSYSFKSDLQLSLYGSLLGTKNILTNSYTKIVDCIWGITENGKRISLLNASIQEFGSNQLIQSEATVEYACISSTHFLTPKTDLFDKISINLNCNENFFFGLYNKMSIEEIDDKQNKRKYIFESTEERDLLISDPIKISLSFIHNTRHSHTSENQFEFSQRVNINTQISAETNFQKAINYCHSIRSLFSFFSRYKVFFRSIYIREKESNEYFDVVFSQENRNDIEKISSLDLVLKYNDLNGEFEKTLEWWVSNSEFTTFGLNLYQQLIYSSGLSPEQKFLNITFALETLHSTLFSKTNFAPSEYIKFKSQSQKFEMDEVFRSRFRECIGNFNELSFKNRILELCESSCTLIKNVIVEFDEFSKKIRNQRNYYVHNHSEERSNLIKTGDLDYYTFMCKAIYESVFLSKIGLSEKSIDLMLKRDFIFNYFKSKKPVL